MTPTRRVTLIAFLSALSFLLMFFKFPLIPSASFLEVEFSLLPILLGLVLLDQRSSLTILLLRSILKLLLHNAGPSTVIGLPMNMLSLALFVWVMDQVWNQSPSLRRYTIAALFATLASTLAMLVLNYIYAIPLYRVVAHFDIEQVLGLVPYLVAMVLPFNLLQGLILSLAFYFVYQALSSRLKSC